VARVVNPPRPGRLREWAYQDEDIRLAQGAEMGRFLLGSTVVLLFPRRDGPAWPSTRLGAGWGGPHGAGDGPASARP
jgi:phosphatidylserine decarboxylase